MKIGGEGLGIEVEILFWRSHGEGKDWNGSEAVAPPTREAKNKLKPEN
jgi:hypothetical protein